ncbi:glycosyltransferase [Sphingomonas adhaesiva]|uniref:Glycosyltransferase family 2 protein n=1 Tax=Sphingomonas adhaesiva TaxID=28212 RepID=A0A2A4I1U1_9SPHN|nr:glycosyltransferase family 2 protein [Sphingomonas adhaesiva]PCG12957.1 glycosyltransferase family 2 protein [Sphingomonas adhaesiva]
MRTACIIPTYNGRDDLARLLASLVDQTLAYDLVIVDSSSTDGTEELALRHASLFFSVASRDFDHGGTRQMVVDQLPNYDILIFLTQDAELASPDALERLVANFDNPQIGAVCARQIPHLDANPFAQHARAFNYPVQRRIVDQASARRFGLKAAFMSNSFAAYRRQSLIDVGGFPRSVILAEDMFVAARMILAGWKVAYDGETACRHSHNYSIMEEFRRYFDLGVFHAKEPWIRASLGGAGSEGRAYVVSELRFLGARQLPLWPVSLLRSIVKLIGYKAGQAEGVIPLRLKRRMSMHRGFWK